MRRLAALYPQETISAEIIDAELAEATAPRAARGRRRAVGPEPLSAAMERHIRQFLAAHRRTGCRCTTSTTG